MSSDAAAPDVCCRLVYRQVEHLRLGDVPDVFEAACYLIAAAVRRDPIGCPRHDPELRSRAVNRFAWQTASACRVLSISQFGPLEMVLAPAADDLGAAAAALTALPQLVAGAPDLLSSPPDGPYEADVINAYRRLLESIGRPEFKPRRPSVRPSANVDLREQRELDALRLIARAVTTAGGAVIDSADRPPLATSA